MAIVVPKWGDGSLWGDGDLWARQYGATPYIARFYTVERGITTDWNLQSPDGTVWVPSITTAGIVSFTSDAGATVSAVPIFLGFTGVWEPSIANTGIVTLTTATDTRQLIASLVDPDEVTWYGQVNNSIASFQTRLVSQVEPKVNRLSVRVTWEGNSSFVIDSVRPLVNLNEQLPDRFQAITDVDTGERISIRVTVSTNQDFVLDSTRIVANTRHQQPTG